MDKRFVLLTKYCTPEYRDRTSVEVGAERTMFTVWKNEAKGNGTRRFM